MNEEKKIDAKFIIQSPKNMIPNILRKLKNIQSEVTIKEYYSNIDEIFEISSLIISRSGAGTINDLINHQLPSILIPLPSAKDNHQFFNASLLAKHQLSIIIHQKNNELNKAKNYIYDIYNNEYIQTFLSDKFNKIKVKNSNSLIYKLINNEK